MTVKEFNNCPIGQQFVENSSSALRYIRAVKVSNEEIDTFVCWMNPEEGYPKERTLRKPSESFLDEIRPVEKFYQLTNDGLKVISIDEL